MEEIACVLADVSLVARGKVMHLEPDTVLAGH